MTAATKEKATTEIKPIDAGVMASYEKVKENGSFKIEKDGTNIQVGNLYIDMGEEVGLDKETLEKVSNLNAKFAAVTGTLVGYGAIDAYKENKELENVTVTFPMVNKDKMVVSSKRHTVNFAVGDRSKTTDVYGGITAVMEQSLGNKNSGLFGAVSQNIRAAAADALRDL